MGRDRDPFERSLVALRTRVTAPDAVTELSLAVVPLAAELGVSPTPVREALAHLAGEGLVTRASGGYRARSQDRASLEALYGLASILIDAAIARGLAADENAEGEEAGRRLGRLYLRVSNRALGAAIARVMCQLAPFRAAEDAALGHRDADALEAALAQAGQGAGTAARAYFRRRARHAGEIIAAAMGLA